MSSLRRLQEGSVYLNRSVHTSGLEKYRAFAISAGKDIHRRLESGIRILDAECRVGFER